MHVSGQRVRTDRLCSPTSIRQHTVPRHRSVVTVPLVASRAGTSDLKANQHLAIVVDNRILSAPYIDPRQNPEGVDGTHGSQISGGPTTQTATRLAGPINTEPLPAPLNTQ